MNPIQLKLWADDNGLPVQCTHCGTTFDALPQLRQRQAAVMDDPRVRALPSPSRDFLVAVLPILAASPEPVGPRTLADEVPYSRSAVGHQLQRLADYGIVRARLMRAGGRYCRYELAIG